jgi:hypothetical protein
MRHLLAALLLFCSAAHAAPIPLTPQQITNIVAHCNCEMLGESCILMTRKVLETEPLVIPFFGIVAPADRNFLVKSGDNMCKDAERTLLANSISARSMIVRSKWRAAWAGPCLYPPRPTPTVKPKVKSP